MCFKVFSENHLSLKRALKTHHRRKFRSEKSHDKSRPQQKIHILSRADPRRQQGNIYRNVHPNPFGFIDTDSEERWQGLYEDRAKSHAKYADVD